MGLKHHYISLDSILQIKYDIDRVWLFDRFQMALALRVWIASSIRWYWPYMASWQFIDLRHFLKAFVTYSTCDQNCMQKLPLRCLEFRLRECIIAKDGVGFHDQAINFCAISDYHWSVGYHRWHWLCLIEYPQDCPPQDWLPGRQSWGGQSWPLSVIRIAHLNYNTI